MKDYTPYQKKVIQRYYDQRDVIMLTRLQELVTDLVLAETDAKRDRLWQRADAAMQALKVPDSIRQHILTQRRPDILAMNVKDWLAEAQRSKK